MSSYVLLKLDNSHGRRVTLRYTFDRETERFNVIAYLGGEHAEGGLK